MPKYGFAVVVIAVVAILVVLLLRHSKGVAGTSRFFRLPSTRLGRASVVLFLVALALMVLMSTVFEGALPTVGKLNVGPAIGVLVLLVALVTGVVALVRSRERSWVVWVAVVLPGVVLGAEVISLLIPGE